WWRLSTPLSRTPAPGAGTPRGPSLAPSPCRCTPSRSAEARTRRSSSRSRCCSRSSSCPAGSSPCPASSPGFEGGAPPRRPRPVRRPDFVALLETRELTRLFGGLAPVNRADLTVDKGEIVGLIGPNGAGKTTCFNLLTGFLRPTRGSIVFDGADITGLRPHQIAARGLVRTFQQTALFPDMTTLENVLLGLHLHSGKGPRQVLFSRRDFPADEVTRGREVLEFTGLATHGDQLSRNLPHGHQRVLGIAMALASQPRLLLLDEPVTGMNLDESGRVME